MHNLYKKAILLLDALCLAVCILIFCAAPVCASGGTWIMIGDSYSLKSTRVNYDGRTEKILAAWPDYVIRAFSLKNTTVKRAGGHGFAKPGMRFQKHLDAIPSSKKVTRILVCGGIGNDSKCYNGKGASYAQIRDAMKTFDRTAAEKFPNAKILYSPINWGVTAVRQNKCSERAEWYIEIARSLGWTVLVSGRDALRVSNANVHTFFAEDQIHPNGKGQYLLGKALVKDISSRENLKSSGVKEIKSDFASTRSTPKASAGIKAQAVLLAQMKSVSGTSVTIGWNRIPGTVSYAVYWSGVKGKFRKAGNTSATVSALTKKKLKKGTYYRFYVTALGSGGRVLAKSPVIFACTAGGSYSNCRKVNPNRKAIALKKKWTLTLKAGELYGGAHKTYARLRFISDTPAVASVSSTGIITGQASGKCAVYIIAQNGVWARISVTVI